MNYSPVPISDPQQEWAYIYDVANVDLSKMKAMGVNTLRVYFSYAALFDTDGTVNSAMFGNYERLLQAAYNQGIYVMPDLWVTYNTDYTNAANLSNLENQFTQVIGLFKNSAVYPGILAWLIGDENNNSSNLSPMSDTQMFQFYQTMISYLKANADNTHLYSPVLVNNNDINNSSLTGLVSSADFWSLNVYLSSSGVWNSNVISPYNLSQPLLITEFGNDAYNNNTGTEDDTDQANFFGDVWPNSIGNHLSGLNSSNKLLGACVFEWNDEWWKCNNDAAHDSCGESLSVLPDNYGNEEWFGIASALPINTSGPRTYRPAYATLQSYWTNSPYTFTVPAACGTNPTPSPTISPTPTPNYSAGCVTVLDDFNNGSGGTDTYGGTWGTSWGSGSGGALNYLAPGYSGFSMQFSWSVASGSYGECYANMSSTANPTGAGTGAVNLSNYGQINFWVTASQAGNYWFKVASSQTYGGAGYSWWQAPFSAPTTGWTQVSIPLTSAAFTNPNGNSGTFAQNLQNTTQLVFMPQTNGAAYLWIDDIDLVSTTCLVTNTPTFTFTNSPTRTSTATATSTLAANTPTFTMTSTAMATQTSTNTGTVTTTRTSTATATNTFANTATATNSETSSVTSTYSSTPTFTSVNTPVNTGTFTTTYTSTLTATLTNTITTAATHTATSSATSSNTVTPSATSTATKTPQPPTSTSTSSSTPTLTNSSTSTLSPTSTNTLTATQTGTIYPPTSTVTSSHTPTSTQTLTQTQTNTVTNTGSWTSSATTTSTGTNTMTATVTSSQTSTATSTETARVPSTSTSTDTPINTSTATSTGTATSTNTVTSTNTATSISTSTSTATATFTFTPTIVTGTIIGGAYPNPSQGQPINISVEVGSKSIIDMTVFTLSFRKVVSHSFSMSQTGNVQWDLKDSMGTSVSNGLYYVRVRVRGASAGSILKVLVLR